MRRPAAAELVPTGFKRLSTGVGIAKWV